MIKMSDGITDTYRESRFKPKPISSSTTQKINIPKCCNNCIFITRNPHDNRWKCTNPLQSEWACHKEGDCILHLTCDELATYFRQRAKLTGESMVGCDVRCEFYVESESYSTCKNMDWHHNRTYRCNCEGDTSKCKFWKDKLIGESKVLDKTPRCKHILDNGKCSELYTKYDFQCPFVIIWDIAKTMCKGYDANVRYEVHVLGNSTSIIGVFKTREQAEQFIRDNVKVVEMIP